MEVVGAAGRGEVESDNGSREEVVCGFGGSSRVQATTMCYEGASVAAAGGAISCFSEREGDKAEAIEHGFTVPPVDVDREAVIQDRTESADGGSAQSTGKVAPQSTWLDQESGVVHASKIYTRAMFDQFGELVFKANEYMIEEVEKLKMYKAVYTQAERREKWARGVYVEKILNGGDKFECKCGLFEHTGMPCSHMLKIPQQLIVKRWTRDVKDILPANLQIYQQDHAGRRTMTHRHTAL